MLNDLMSDDVKRVSAEFKDESILWAARPDAFRTFLKLTPIWLFAVPWTAFALGWEYVALAALLGEGQPPEGHIRILSWVFPLFGLPFVLVGLGMMSAPLWGWRRTRQTVHVLTDRRLATARHGRSLDVTSIDIERIASMQRIEKRDGGGTLHLNMGSYRDSDGDTVEKKITIPDVPDVRELERLIAARGKAGPKS